MKWDRNSGKHLGTGCQVFDENAPQAIERARSRWQLIHNVFGSYGFYFTGYLLSFLAVPYLARILGPSEWGVYSLAQAFGTYIILVEEWGFPFSGARAIARNRDSKDVISGVLTGVCGAKVCLGLICIATALIVAQTVPAFQRNPRLFWAAVAWSVLQGANLNWFYQGLERMRTAATVDICIKTIAIVLMIAVVRRPDDGWKAMALNASACLLSLITLSAIALRGLTFHPPDRLLIGRHLREGLTSLLPRNSLIVSSISGVFLVSRFSPAAIVGEYAGAERICRALIGLLNPLTDALYSRISRISVSSPKTFFKTARIVGAVMITVGILIGVSIYLMAPYLVRLVLGPKLEGAVVFVRILAILAPVVALGNTLGVHWMLALGLDGVFSYLTLASVLSTVTIGLALAQRHFATGVAWALVLSQCALTLGIFIALRVYLYRKRRLMRSDAPSGRVSPVLGYLLQTEEKGS